jgi:glutathione peroxidase
LISLKYNIKNGCIEGGEVSPARFRGKVLLIVNAASRCGFTPRNAGLQRLCERCRERGFETLGFPANDFLRQEPGTGRRIGAFRPLNHGVGFPLFAKISVRGRKIHPLGGNFLKL